MKYNQRLRDLRESNDLTQSDVAEFLGTTYQYYSTYESGKRELPFYRAIELAKFYNVSLDYIAGFTPTPKQLYKAPSGNKTITVNNKGDNNKINIKQ